MTKLVRALVLALAVGMVLPVVSLAAWPVVSSRSYVSQRFSYGHRGIDIAAPAGSPVTPISSGKVIFAGWKRNCGGYQVWIAHANNRYTAYYHLSRETTWAGAWVHASYTRIGAVGRTGCASGNHVHVEVWRGYPWRTGSYRINPWNNIMSGPNLPARYR